jgi:hypothetical protein
VKALRPTALDPSIIDASQVHFSVCITHSMSNVHNGSTIEIIGVVSGFRFFIMNLAQKA